VRRWCDRVSTVPLPYARRAVYRSDSLRIEDVRCRAGVSGPGGEERSSTHEVVFPRSGVFVKEVAGRRVVADPNHVVFFNRHEPYRVLHPVPGGDACLSIGLSDGDLLDVVGHHDPGARDDPERPCRRACVPVTARAVRLQRELLSALDGAGAPPEPGIQERVLDLLDEVLRPIVSPPPGPGRPVKRATRDRHREIVETVKVSLQTRLSAAPGLDQIARAVGCAPFHLLRLFRRETGRGIHAYLRALRLRAALERIAEGEASLTRIALDLGFADHSHFTTSFRREFGLTPSAFRRSASRRRLRDLRFGAAGFDS
jgi:AraC family transcriptional regulator